MAANQLFRRIKKPIITAEIFPPHLFYHSVLNPGVGDLHGYTLLSVRAQDMEGISQLVCLTSKDGIKDWKIDERTIFTGEEGGSGVEDARLTWMPTLRKWAIVHTILIDRGCYLPGIALTRNFREYTNLGNVLLPANKDATLFPKPINGYWYLLNRPTLGDNKQIWISRSRCIDPLDESALRSWGEHKLVIPTDGTPRWDGTHIGMSTPPLETNEGWIAIYHGVKNRSYYLGLVMFDLDNPMKVTYRTKRFIMAPQEGDFIGEVGGAIFPCGWRVHHDGDARIVRLYFGTADSKICYAEAPLDEVIKRVMQDRV